ncbi:CD209 antigen-like protein C [Hoplias malabaricus]|uniref:CD209 antigen-like protein C n=1 Tax=Hoplias malabaricus TaxID=27720 RepID=UPI0034631222
MENIYQNTNFQLSKNPRNEECPSSADAGKHNVQSMRDRRPTCTTEMLKCSLAALSLLLFCALGGLCVLGVLYETLSEDYSRALERLSVQQNNTNETERKYEELKADHSRVEGLLSQCNEKCQECPLLEEKWMSFGVKSYYFSTKLLDWEMSRDDCTKKGGHLVIITSNEEQDFLSSKSGDLRWIGLNDLETEGQWMWVNNQSLAETGVSFWHKRPNSLDEPDNWKVEDSSGENCAVLGSEYSSWNDVSCRKKKKYICEK